MKPPASALIVWIAVFIGIAGIETRFPEPFIAMDIEARTNLYDFYFSLVILGALVSLVLAVYGLISRNRPLQLHALLGVLIGSSYIGIHLSGPIQRPGDRNTNDQSTLGSTHDGAHAMFDVILKKFDDPDDVTHFEKGKFETVTLGGMTIGRATYQPGWKWSEDVGPGVGEDFCTVEHVGMVVSGCATAAFADGRVTEMNAGDLFYVPSEPHDSWVVGDQPYVSLHFLGADKYVK